MNRYAIICLDNNPVSTEQIRSELAPFSKHFDIHAVDNIDEAHQALEFMQQHKQNVALVISHHHSQFNGVQFLVDLEQLPQSKQARTILVSHSSDIQAILKAVNEGRLDQCLTKPLQDKVLFKSVLKELTTFIIENESDELLKYSQVLDHHRLLKAHIDFQMRNYQAGFIHDFHDMSDLNLAESVIAALLEFFSHSDDSKALRTYSAEHLLTKEGEANRFLWLITQGQVALYKKDKYGQQREVVRHTKGNLVGGMSFVTGEDSFSTAITLTDTKVIKLDRDIFAQVMQSNSRLLPLFTNLLLRHFNRRLQRSITTKLTLQKTLESLESAHQQLIEKEKMAMLGQLIAGVAHELNNPIAAILRSVETLSSSLENILQQSTPESCALHDAVNSIGTQGLDIIRNAKQSQPLSTATERQLVSNLLPTVENRQIAKKLVRLKLNENQDYIRSLLDNESPLQELEALERYHLTGNAIRSISVCAERIADMVKSLKGYAREDDEKLHIVDIHEGIEDTLVIFENRLKVHKLERHYQADLPHLCCQPFALQQVWTNLLSNALDALPTCGEITVTTRTESRLGKSGIVVEVLDSGHGIPSGKVTSIFTPNYTTKKEGNFGLGIGLSICKQIVTAHNGDISVDSQVNAFTKIKVWLPLISEGNSNE
ncbi:ATP-binding protein [Vibrio makurazakiensis]|uniref:ATP-binding protein n=1 Tax=Vibrio makurazakiensis TaxID=2910250 RepID=UPI003D0DE1B0